MRYPAYPDYTATRWPEAGSIPSGWEARRLKFAATCNDEALPETTDPDYEIAYVDISSVDLVNGITAVETHSFDEAPSRARRIVRDGDTIVSTVRTYLKAIAPIESPPDNMIVSTGFAVIRPLESVNSRYLGYALQNTAFIDEVVANSTGVSYPAINPTTLIGLPVSYPEDKTEQQQIAAFLDWQTGQIDALIAKKKELLEKLKEKRLAVITQAVTKGLDPTTPLRDSGTPWLGQVPEHWEVRRLKFTASEPLMYGANEAAELDDPEFPRYIRITDVKEDGSLHDDTFRSLPPDVAEPYLLKDGDILLARSGATVGKSFQYLGTWGRAAYAGYLIRLRVDTNVVNARFAYFFMQSDLYWACINSTLIQATIQNFSANKYDNINVPIPPLDEQMKIVNQIEKQKSAIDKQEAATAQAIVYLTEYRTALITAATTGKIDVRNVKIGMAA
ncbi:MAG: restriction endonuclease subunit S [Sulfurimicrobium sp.]|nr:restriction endonuclease subunit S [Sulfurimicrobium sp.]MDP1703876.1 restriction endonuclease subunit S [Sulfurimicrobium sp.]MDP2199050.1 restriction endonuclease subunit S [Sulfurimicrobium sp.]MDP3689136.1 restriction endonuclease subunit S [Sulfurimicrobium sp.]